MLSNPYYIDFLIEKQFFNDTNFHYYLKYLNYIKTPELIRYIKFPIALKMLDNLQNEAFVNQWIND